MEAFGILVILGCIFVALYKGSRGHGPKTGSAPENVDSLSLYATPNTQADPSVDSSSSCDSGSGDAGGGCGGGSD